MTVSHSTRCPICGAGAKPRSDNPAFPFCGERCRSVDLGNWLDERYRIETTPPDPDEDGADEGELS